MGKLIVIEGTDGSGKSTLIQLINGLEKTSEGKIFYKGRNIYEKGFSLTEMRAHVGLIFQYPEYQLFEETVLKDVMFGPINFGMDPETAARKTVEALKMVGFPEEKFNESPLELSGGQKRRVAIAGIIACDPKIIVLDEPTAGLDPKGAKDMIELFVQLNKKLKIRNFTKIRNCIFLWIEDRKKRERQYLKHLADYWSRNTLMVSRFRK